MIKKIKLALISIISIATLTAPVLAPAAVYAADSSTVDNGLCQGAQLEIGTSCSGVDETAAQDQLNSIITLVINIFSIVVGIAAVIMIIVGGLRYIISGGDSGNVQGAKNTILYAIIGLVVVALAQFIVKFVLGKVTTS